MFPVAPLDRRLPLKAKVLGVRVGAEAKAYPVDAIAREGAISDTVGGTPLLVNWAPGGTVYVTDTAGELLPAVEGFWFAWSAFNPGTQLYP